MVLAMRDLLNVVNMRMFRVCIGGSRFHGRFGRDV